MSRSKLSWWVGGVVASAGVLMIAGVLRPPAGDAVRAPQQTARPLATTTPASSSTYATREDSGAMEAGPTAGAAAAGSGYATAVSTGYAESYAQGRAGAMEGDGLVDGLDAAGSSGAMPGDVIAEWQEMIAAPQTAGPLLEGLQGLKAGVPGRAASAFAVAVFRAPEAGSPRFLLAHALLAAGNLEGAAVAMHRAFALNPALLACPLDAASLHGTTRVHELRCALAAAAPQSPSAALAQAFLEMQGGDRAAALATLAHVPEAGDAGALATLFRMHLARTNGAR